MNFPGTGVVLATVSNECPEAWRPHLGGERAREGRDILFYVVAAREREPESWQTKKFTL